MLPIKYFFGSLELRLVSFSVRKFLPSCNPPYAASSAKYIAEMWNKAGLKSSTIKGLPGCMSIYSPNAKTLFEGAPLSHIDCI